MMDSEMLPVRNSLFLLGCRSCGLLNTVSVCYRVNVCSCVRSYTSPADLHDVLKPRLQCHHLIHYFAAVVLLITCHRCSKIHSKIVLWWRDSSSLQYVNKMLVLVLVWKLFKTKPAVQHIVTSPHSSLSRLNIPFSHSKELSTLYRKKLIWLISITEI